MEIALTAKGPSLGAWLAPQFGTSEHIMIVNDRNRFKSLPNLLRKTESEGDVALAQRLFEEHIDALVTGSLSREAFAVLKEAEIAVCLTGVDAILTLVEKVREGTLPAASDNDFDALA